MFYIFYGDDELARDEALEALLARVEDPGMGDLNTTKLDGNDITFADIQSACDALPFMGERRIVIVHGVLGRFKQGNKEFQHRLAAYLPTMPETTRLFFIERGVDKRLRIWNVAQELANADPPKAYVREFAAPHERALPAWIKRRVHKKGGQIDNRAAQALAETLGTDDLRLLDQELEKLVNYASDAPSGRIDVEAVSLLVPYTQQANIFDLVDAIGQRRGSVALRRLHHLLNENAAPPYLLHMIVRQIRLLLQFKELQSLGMTKGEIRSQTGQHPFVVEKGLRQAQNFSLEQLEAAFDHLLQTDFEIKTGQTEPALALELLVTELAGSASPPRRP